MSKYARIACLATEQARNGNDPVRAWYAAAERIYPEECPARNKSCPRCAFLGLAEEGLIDGVPSGSYTRSSDNKRYAIEALRLLWSDPTLCDDSDELWRRVMDGMKKKHNDQMDVVTALWKADYLKQSSRSR